MTTQATNRQLPDHAILDYYNKQTYLGNSYVLSGISVSLASTTETVIALLQNPALSGTAAQNGKGMFLQMRRFSSSAQPVTMKLYSQPTVSTTSTASVPTPLRLSSPFASMSKCYASGNFTVSANGTLITSIGVPSGDSVTSDALMVILDPGYSVLLTATALTSTTIINSEISWYEI